MNIKYKRGLLCLFLIVLLAGCSSSQSRIKRENTSEANYKLGIAYLNDSTPDTQKAYIEFLKAIESNPENRDAHYALGHVSMQRQDYPNAVSAFKKAIAIDQNYSEAHNYLGKAYDMLGQDQEAILSYQAALKNLQYGTPQLPHWNLGLIYLKQKQYDKALESLLQVRRLEPTNAIVLDKIAETHIEKGDKETARSFFKEAESIRKSLETPK